MGISGNPRELVTKQQNNFVGAACPNCLHECFRIVPLPLGGNGCRSCFAADQRLRSTIPPRLADTIAGMKNGELGQMVTHMRDICPKGHPAVHRFDPGLGGYALICLGCSTQGVQLYEGRCQECGAPCWSIYSLGTNGIIWKIRCAAGHTKSRTL